MYKDFEAEQVMLSDELKKKREDELFNQEKELRDLQRKRFGFEGDLFKKRQKLVKPIQDKVYNASENCSSRAVTILFWIKVKELPLSLPTQNWTRAKMY